MHFKTKLPEFHDEVASLLERIQRNDLRSQLPYLEIDQRCPCTDFGCASFTVSGSSISDRFESPGERRRMTFTKKLDIKSDRGKIVLNLDQLGRITGFEVLNRNDVRRQLFKR